MIGPSSGVRDEEQRHHQQVGEHEQEHRALPEAEDPVAVIAISPRPQRHREVLRDTEVPEREAHADELGDDDQEVLQEKEAGLKPAPPPAEALDDQPRVANPGHRAEPDDHLLVDDQHRNQQQQDPKQAHPVRLPRLCVGADAPGIVVSHHHDQARSDDRQ